MSLFVCICWFYFVSIYVFCRAQFISPFFTVTAAACLNLMSSFSEFTEYESADDEYIYELSDIECGMFDENGKPLISIPAAEAVTTSQPTVTKHTVPFTATICSPKTTPADEVIVDAPLTSTEGVTSSEVVGVDVDEDHDSVDECLDYESITVDTMEFQCQCGRSYSTEASLRFHRYECGKEPSFQCPHCDYCGKRKTTLNKHIRSKHAGRCAAGGGAGSATGDTKVLV